MSRKPGVGIAQHFALLTDPRVERTKQHLLLAIVVIALCAVICGAECWGEIDAFGRAKHKWLKRLLRLPNGIPSHDTFGRVFARLDSVQFQECFLAWIQAISEVTHGQVIAVDGKTAIHMVSAWATANRLVLGQVKVDEKSNPIAISMLIYGFTSHPRKRVSRLRRWIPACAGMIESYTKLESALKGVPVKSRRSPNCWGSWNWRGAL